MYASTSRTHRREVIDVLMTAMMMMMMIQSLSDSCTDCGCLNPTSTCQLLLRIFLLLITSRVFGEVDTIKLFYRQFVV